MRGKIRIGISACLLGESVRYDGGHKHAKNIVDRLGRYFELIPFCPEVGAGMGVPRQPIQLVQNGSEVRALAVENHAKDFTLALENFCHEEYQRIAGLDGFVLKKDSPSCGIDHVKVFRKNPGNDFCASNGEGVFARAIKKLFPALPLVDEDGVREKESMQSFIMAVLSHHEKRTGHY